MFKYISGTFIFSNIDVVSSKVNMKDSVPKTPCAISLFPKIPLKGATIFLQIDDNYTSCFKQSYETLFSNNFFKTETIWRRHSEDYLNDANTLVQFGWKSEAIPITRENKSFIARIFEKIFK